jgi:hypothetical protein
MHLSIRTAKQNTQADFGKYYYRLITTASLQSYNASRNSAAYENVETFCDQMNCFTV